MSFSAPIGMSYVNAWWALYQAANLPADTEASIMAQQKQLISNGATIARIFFEHCTDQTPLFCREEFAGKKMDVHLCDFPIINPDGYDKLYGAGAAQRALTEYDRVPSEDRFDRNDQCSFETLIEERAQRFSLLVADFKAKSR